MRNPCDLYISLAHYGGAKGHTGRPWWPNWYGGDWASKATNPVPDINYTVWPPQIGTPGADIRRNVPVAMMEAYVYAARRAASGVGWYSFMLWEQVVAGECLFSQFVDKHGKEHTFNRTEKGSTLWKACYGDPARVKRYTHALTLHVSSSTRMLCSLLLLLLLLLQLLHQLLHCNCTQRDTTPRTKSNLSTRNQLHPTTHACVYGAEHTRSHPMCVLLRTAAMGANVLLCRGRRVAVVQSAMLVCAGDFAL